MNRTDLSFLERIFNCPLDQIESQVLIVNQSTGPVLESHFSNLSVIHDKEYGLSCSRNIAIASSKKPLLWILDDDCTVLPDAIDCIISSHNSYQEPVITFQTKRIEHGQPFWNYPRASKILSKTQIQRVLSPEITLKKEAINRTGITFNELFGLGAQFQDSENYIFLTDLINKNLDIRHVPEFVVAHNSTTSSDEAFSDRVIYARGALAARKGIALATFLNFKYTFFLLRKGVTKNFVELIEKHKVFRRGVKDYKSLDSNKA